MHGNGLYVEGASNILNQPEFREDFGRLKAIFSAFEEKSLIVKIIDKASDGGKSHVFFGSDARIDGFRDLSFVTAHYGNGPGIHGTIGVIGPLRMDYSRIIPLVDYTAGLLSELL
jgi:heat-inducible transcriptional repressor